jgi:hypothetical protein
MFTYEDIRSVYEELIRENVIFYPIIGVKVLALMLLVISYYNKYLKSMKPNNDGEKMPVTPYDLAFGIILVLSVIFYDRVLDILDGAFGSIENQYITDTTSRVNLNDVSDTEITKPAESKHWTDSIKEMATKFGEFFNDPLIIVLWIVKGIAWLFTALAYGVYLAERFFFLGLLRVFGGLALACLSIKQLEKWFWNWLGLYASIFLVIIPYFLIELFVNVVHEKYMVKFKTIDTGIGVNGSSSVLGALLIIFLASLQFKLYKRSGEILMKIFS